MIDFLFLLILFSASGSGIMSGLFFVFSNFAMQSFAKLPPAQGAAAMQSININILNAWFLLVFAGTGLLSLLLIVMAALRWGQPGMIWVLTGGLLYFLGCIVVTGTKNVPLNNRLAAVDPESEEGAAMWKEYLEKWLPWNHVRTFATITSTLAFIMALSVWGAAAP